MPPPSCSGQTAFEAELSEIDAELRARPSRHDPEPPTSTRGLAVRRLALFGALPLAAFALTLLRLR